MTYQNAIDLCNHHIAIKLKELELLKQCIQYLDNEQYATDDMVQTPEQILVNHGITGGNHA